MSLNEKQLAKMIRCAPLLPSPGDTEVAALARECLALRGALRECVDALDRLMGDSDLDEDDSLEFKAMQGALSALG